MYNPIRPWRSVLYVPGSNARAIEKACSLPVDAVILDLEDAVAPSEKARARDIVTDALGADFGARARLVRINALTTDWGRQDAAALRGLAPEGVLLPKVAGPGDLAVLAGLVPGLPLWAMIETPAGVLNAPAIAAHPHLAGLVLGTNDLAQDLGARTEGPAGRAVLAASLQLTLLAARAAGRICIDGVYNAFRDEAGFARECAEARDLGFDGKTLIHPGQAAAANAAFAPTLSDLEQARRRIEAFAEAEAKGLGVAVVDGKIVENLHIAAARHTLAKAAAIGRMGNAA